MTNLYLPIYVSKEDLSEDSIRVPRHTVRGLLEIFRQGRENRHRHSAIHRHHC